MSKKKNNKEDKKMDVDGSDEKLYAVPPPLSPLTPPEPEREPLVPPSGKALFMMVGFIATQEGKPIPLSPQDAVKLGVISEYDLRTGFIDSPYYDDLKDFLDHIDEYEENIEEF